MKDFSFITHSHPAYIENLYKDFVQNPESVDPDYRKFFEGFDFAISNLQNGNGKIAEDVNGKVAALSSESKPTLAIDGNQLLKELSVYNLILAYRRKGHLLAKTNPIRERKNRVANLELKYFGLSEADLAQSFAAGQFIGLGTATLQNIIDRLQKIYTGHVGIEYQYVLKQNRVDWLEKEVETTLQQDLPIEKKRRILEKLNEGVIFEKFLHTKYVGQKRFSLEGGEQRSLL